MNARFFHTVACYSIATAGLLLATFLPGTLSADGDANKPNPIATPTLHVSGFDLSARLADGIVARDLPAGSKPSIELIVTNTTKNAGEIPWTLQLTADAPANPMARTMPIPHTLWTKSGSVALQPGETRTLAIDTDTATPANMTVQLDLISGNNAIAALPIGQPAAPLDPFGPGRVAAAPPTTAPVIAQATATK